ncbi:hypothetical protein DFH06DRAFT_1130508 [Mycena polygramma]|nr:hypothetical protein DFH06DRAFT_1130508 [Mycena polygramma]
MAEQSAIEDKQGQSCRIDQRRCPSPLPTSSSSLSPLPLPQHPNDFSLLTRVSIKPLDCPRGRKDDHELYPSPEQEAAVSLSSATPWSEDLMVHGHPLPFSSAPTERLARTCRYTAPGSIDTKWSPAVCTLASTTVNHCRVKSSQPYAPVLCLLPIYLSRFKSTTSPVCARFSFSVTADELDHLQVLQEEEQSQSISAACPWTVDAAARVLMDIHVALHTRTPLGPHLAAVFSRSRLPSDSALLYVSRGTCAVSPVSSLREGQAKTKGRIHAIRTSFRMSCRCGLIEHSADTLGACVTRVRSAYSTEVAPFSPAT